ncbi:UDP-2,3-diacylglucosamine diphosphatase [Aporhodopirellula aestuarii]|uniref:UDP-2,3-diacylglucosamine diphosphatase n=1 Tax=Aporhodopirellula aestuarii TaxID=2950107 RepID=A0ABT0U6G4_9BACT|nr:UDP-2,3-diacylglucosamine diphosphatase [Aporhodopirellula aestuarii]MCM2372130.1 UDP-2,3-diacylglucosamine diphosphatase [Aporhodopirellula aestuarii]
MQRSAPTPVRTLLVSDVHLGCKHSRAEEFLAFLRGFQPESIYLVGDFIDSWKINAGWHWTPACDDVIMHLIELAKNGTKVHYVSGNHDAFLRNPAFQSGCLTPVPRFEVANEFVMETVDGWRFLITHGDMFDCVETNAQWLSKGCSVFYDACLSFNRWWHNAWMAQDRNPYGGCAVLKDRIKRWIRFVSGFETKIMMHARQSDCDGVICGHIHTPDIVSGDAMWYCNTGDWVENCTGLIERHDGQMQLVRRYDDDLFLRLPRRRSTRPETVDSVRDPVPAVINNSEEWVVTAAPGEYAA